MDVEYWYRVNSYMCVDTYLNWTCPTYLVLIGHWSAVWRGASADWLAGLPGFPRAFPFTDAPAAA